MVPGKWLPGALAFVVMVCGGPVPVRASAAPRQVGLTALSSRPDLVTGHSVLVGLTVPGQGDRLGATVAIRGSRKRFRFAPLPDGRLAASVTGLPRGRSTLEARLVDGSRVRLTVTAHSIKGPLFSGPRLKPYICGTYEAGLGPPGDAECSAPRRYRYAYLSAVTGQFHDLADGRSKPADVAKTTTDEGQTVDYKVRIERGVIDRAIYDVAVLYDPTRPKWSPWIKQRGWNGKLLWTFGGNGFPDHRQLLPSNVLTGTDGIQPAVALERGYAVASTSLNVLGNNINTITSAEALAMTKEHFVETYGPPRFTVGMGCSGGSVNVHEIAEVYPGLLDGILANCSFPDMWAPVTALVDCALLERYWNHTSPHLWAVPAHRRSVAGDVAPTACAMWSEVTKFQDQVFDPSFGCVGAVTLNGWDRGTVEQPDWVYHPQRNPHGVRCTVQDYSANVYGRERPRGWAGRPWDNVGVPYGLDALNSGVITAEQFVDLNEKVGGYDIDFNWTPKRTVADPQALRIAYHAGRVTHGSRGLARTAIIDFRTFDPEDVHSDYHSFSMRERLMRANGNAANHVIIRATGPAWMGFRALFETVIEQMDRWMTRLESDKGTGPLPKRVARARPEDLVDACYVDDGRGAISETDAETCATAYPYGESPRGAAGGPLTNDVLKCRLKPIKRSDYHTAFGDAQWSRLRAVFRNGACDWSKRGVSQRPPVGTWLTFNSRPGGRLMPAPPRSVSFSRQEGS